MNLTEKPETVTWPATHYVFVEKLGPFQETAPKAWGEVHPLVPAIAEHNKLTGYLSLYKPDPQKMTYRAGVSLGAKPEKLPDGLQYVHFAGGTYVALCLNRVLLQPSRSLWPRLRDRQADQAPAARRLLYRALCERPAQDARRSVDHGNPDPDALMSAVQASFTCLGACTTGCRRPGDSARQPRDRSPREIRACRRGASRRPAPAGRRRFLLRSTHAGRPADLARKLPRTNAVRSPASSARTLNSKAR